MNKPRPILWITITDALDINVGEMDNWATEMGYALLVTFGRQQSAKVLSHKKMRRADYASVVAAANKIMHR